MYSEWISYDVYSRWPVYSDWIESDTAAFDEYCMGLHPEVRMINRRWEKGQVHREFVFESEAHHAWFLLKVT